jgi:ABC-type multidrug transport system fused ATPase/permease subunit
MKSGKVVDEGTYAELKGRHSNFTSWVSDVAYVDDDPTGLLEKVNEIRLDAVNTVTERSKQISLLKPENPRGPLSHLPMRKMTKPRSSPLASAIVITAQRGDTLNEKAGLELLMEQNSNSIQNAALNEHTISKLIERNQGSILTGNTLRPPANFANQDIVSRTIEANQLTVHSVHTFDAATVEPGVFNEAIISDPWKATIQFLKEGTGLYAGVLIIGAFFFSATIRILSGTVVNVDVWLSDFVVVENRQNYSPYIGIYGAFCAAIAVSVVFRSFGFAFFILSKSMLWHKRIVEAALLAPMSFYESTPLGHILSFFSRHLFLVDEVLPETALQVLAFLPFIIGGVVLVCCVVPWFWATLPVYFILGFLVIRKCVTVQQQFQQLESNNKSPMFGHLSSTLQGLFSIRLYHVEERFDMFNRMLIDADHKALYSMLLGTFCN